MAEDRSYRYERKFLVSDLDRFELESMIQVHPAGFREIYRERYINNIYFDDANWGNFSDNLDGSMFRTKYRIRWYHGLNGPIMQPVLEAKIKQGLMGTKQSFHLRSFNFEDAISEEHVQTALADSDMPEKMAWKLDGQQPWLVNRYCRKYFLSSDGSFRLTLDWDLSFARFPKNGQKVFFRKVEGPLFVLELKYEKEKDAEASLISNEFPFRMTKSSKYAMGMEMVYDF